MNIEEADRIIGDEYSEKKSIYVLAFQDGSSLIDKINKITASFKNESYNLRIETLDQDMARLQIQRNETKDILRNTKRMFRDYLEVANSKEGSDVSVFKVYKVFILKEKTIYSYLNMLNQSNMILQGLAWCPKYFQLGEKLNVMINHEGLEGLTIEHVTDDI